ncbi:MAG TPA: MFS transporter [Gammaproteobacteria bacterium]|nr:MFS transporter [Gammaproteobacteria bacterium]
MIKIKDKIASGLGSILEWYDFALYGFFAPLIAQLYFPSAEPSIGLLKTFSVFAIGFFARPLGALLFGYISDKHGRTTSLKLTPLLIACPTLLLSILPTYQQIGIFATIILIMLRIWQGICIGGEYANNIVYLCESTQPKHVYFLGSIGSCTGSFGILLASSIATLWYEIFPSHSLLLWGWRIAFAISLIIAILTYLMRRNMLETPVFQQGLKTKIAINNPILASYKDQWQDYLIACGLTFLPATAFYYVFMFLPNYLNSMLKFDADKILGDNSFSLLIRLFIIPFLGLVADKIGGIRIARLSCILFLLLSFPLFYGIIYYPTFTNVFIYGFALLTTLNAATTPGLLVELLKPETRCTILSFTFNFCFGVFGGIVPIISFLLVNELGSKMASIYYLMFAAVITLIATFFFKKGRQNIWLQIITHLSLRIQPNKHSSNTLVH